jgi:hypothetical protein
MEFNSKSAAIAATAIVGCWAVSAAFIVARFGWHSTAGIRVMIIGMPGVIAAAWIQYWTEPSTLGSVAAYTVLAATNWLFWFGVARGTTAIKRRLLG